MEGSTPMRRRAGAGDWIGAEGGGSGDRIGLPTHQDQARPVRVARDLMRGEVGGDGMVGLGGGDRIPLPFLSFTNREIDARLGFFLILFLFILHLFSNDCPC
jgi:hypothetical protein